MRRSQLNFESHGAEPGDTFRLSGSIRSKPVAKQFGGGMNSVPGRRFRRVLSSALSVLGSFILVISLSGSFDNALAGDDPAVSGASSSEANSLDIPGSFKDLPTARDIVTAKRSPEQIRLPAGTEGTSPQLVIDADKVAAAAAPTFLESDLVDFNATAYCLKGRTASGINTRPGMIAADPRVLPMGTVVHLRAGRYTGTYTVMDTGSRIKGRIVDVYVPTFKEAMEFGRRQVKIKVINRGPGKRNRASKSLAASGL